MGAFKPDSMHGKIRAIALEMAKRPQGIRTADISGFPTYAVATQLWEMKCRGQLFGVKVNGKHARCFATQELADAYAALHPPQPTTRAIKRAKAEANAYKLRGRKRQTSWPSCAAARGPRAKKP